MKTAALVPFKCFTRAKRRLRSVYSDAQVEALGRAMLADVLDALLAAPSLDRVAVLTDDEAVARVAEKLGAEVRLESPDPGLNPVIELGSAQAERDGFDAALVVPGACPLPEPPAVEALPAAAGEPPVVLGPSDGGGTPLLSRRPPQVIPARFGGRSADAHRREAERRGVACHVLDGLDARVSIDLDTPEDARRLLENAHASRTRALLEEWSP